MTQERTWMITGAGRGVGLDFAKAALAAGHNVAATGRSPEAVARAVGGGDVSEESTTYAELSIDDYAERNAAQIDAYRELSTSLAHEDATAEVA
jgi:NAD(P)-dependent dehydrogenase (short-subunit alcohol dehydrogenase family)